MKFGGMTGIIGQLKWETLKKRRKDNRLIFTECSKSVADCSVAAEAPLDRSATAYRGIMEIPICLYIVQRPWSCYHGLADSAEIIVF